jgi:uncharacterized protein (DUF1501 family)
MSRCSCPDHVPNFRRRGVSRREVLKYALGGAGIVALGPVVGKYAPRALGAPMGNKILILVNMDGGCDTLNAVIPSTLQPYFDARPTIQIPNASSLDLSTGPTGTTKYRLHPSFVKTKALWDAGDVALVNRVGYPDENLSHFESQDIYAWAIRDGFDQSYLGPSGWVARYAGLYAPTPLGAVSVGQGKPTTFAGGTSHPLQVNSLSSFRFNGDNAFSANHTYRLQIAKNVLAAASTAGVTGEVRQALSDAHDLTGSIQGALTAYNARPGAATIVYQNTGISNAMKDVAALVFGGFETRIFYVGLGGFDTHGDQGAAAGQQADLFTDMDDAFGSFHDDMVAMGQWDNVVILCYSEFGRRNYENGSGGTDHGAALAELVLGGAVNGGAKGPDLVDADVTGEYVTYAVDFRDVLKEIVADHLGANPAPIFTEAQPTNTVVGVV